LYRFNGNAWDNVDKSLLMASAYSTKYIALLIELLGNNEYEPDLLTPIEKQKIEQTLQG